MMSTTSCLTIASIESRNSARVCEIAPPLRHASRRPDRVQARPHIGVLGVGDDEIRAPIGAAADACELFVEPEHECLSSFRRRFTGRSLPDGNRLERPLALIARCR